MNETLAASAEFTIGSIVPVLEHLGRGGDSCLSLEGTVVGLDEFGKPMEAKCVKCEKPATINRRKIHTRKSFFKK